ncbi:hypothetical protein H8E77_41615 [bacterium]|nr:hypothetical protein [bacterium]
MNRKQTYLGSIFHVTEQYEDIVDAVLTKGTEVDRTYFESDDFEVKGSAILERHEIRSPGGVPERLRLDNILLRHHNLSTQQAQLYQDLMVKADFTYAAAISQLDHQQTHHHQQNGISSGTTTNKENMN